MVRPLARENCQNLQCPQMGAAAASSATRAVLALRDPPQPYETLPSSSSPGQNCLGEPCDGRHIDFWLPWRQFVTMQSDFGRKAWPKTDAPEQSGSAVLLKNLHPLVEHFQRSLIEDDRSPLPAARKSGLSMGCIVLRPL
jgi:hypothetical protein